MENLSAYQPSLARLYSAAASPSEQRRSDGSLAIRLVIEEGKLSVGSSSNFQKPQGEKCDTVPVWLTLPELKSVFLVVQVRPLHILNTINAIYIFS